MNFPPAQLVQVPLRVGLDEGVEPSQAPPGTLTLVQNGVWNKKVGRLEKRDGSVALDMSTIDGSDPPVAASKLLARGSELACIDGGRLYSRSADGWRRVARVPSLQATWSTAVDSSRVITAVDVDADTSRVVTVWASSTPSDGTFLYGKIDDRDGGVILPPTFLGSTDVVAGAMGLRLRVLVDPATGIATLFYIDGSKVWAAVFGPSGFLTAAELFPAVVFDARRKGDVFLFAYGGVGGTIGLVEVSSSFVVGTPVVVLPVGPGTPKQVSLCFIPGEALYLAWSHDADNDVTISVHDPLTFAQTAGPTAIHATSDGVGPVAIARRDESSVVVAWSELHDTDRPSTYSVAVTSAATVVLHSQRQTFWSGLMSAVFQVGDRFYALLSTVRRPQRIGDATVSENSAYVVEIETSNNGGEPNAPHRLAAVVAPRESARVALDTKVPVVGDVALFPVTVATETEPYASSVAMVPTNSVRLVRLERAQHDPWRSAPIGQTLALSGAVATVYDGRETFELGFLQPPRVISATPGVGGNMAAGTYLYSFVYEWRDATGLLHRSQPSIPTSVTVAANGSVAFELECATTCGRSSLDVGFGYSNALPVRIVPYRSAEGGAQLYRMSFGSANVLENDPTSESIAWTDASHDDSIDNTSTDLTTRPLLYTTGGVLEDVAPPGLLTLIQHRGRLWGVSGDRRSVWFTKRFTDNPDVFPGFHENLRIVLDAEIVALESLDDKLVILTTDSIYVVYGDGPAANGQGSDLTVPTLVHGEMPCLSARCVVGVPAGVMFLSGHGLYLLTRQLELAWVGRAVREQLERFPIPRSAAIVAHKSQVRLAFASGGEGGGVVLVFDYANGLWSTFTYPQADVASLVVVGREVYFAAESTVMREDASTCLDDGAWVTLDFELPLAPSGPVAWQHVRRVKLQGERRTDHDLRLRLGFNEQVDYAQDFTFTSDMVATNNDSPTVRVGSQNGANPKCRMLRVRVSDGSPTGVGAGDVGTGKGGWFSAIALELIPKPGLPRHGARHSKV